MSGGNDSGLDTTVTGNSVPQSGETSGMFQPTYISGYFPGNGTEEVETIFASKYCMERSIRPISSAGAIKVPMNELLRSSDPGEHVAGTLMPLGYTITSHGGYTCFATPAFPCLPTASEFKVYKGCNSLEEQDEETTVFSTPRLDHKKYFVNLLLHMRVDNNGQDYKILVGGRYTGGKPFTFVYDSKSPHEWRDVSGPLFVLEYLQGGAIYKPAHTSECLLCISTLGVRNYEISSYDFMTKKWSTLHEIPPTSQDLLGIEECGGIIFLFSQAKIGEDIRFFIHKLNGVSNANNASWEEITSRKRIPASGKGFFVFPDTKCVPTEFAIEDCGGCAYVFNPTSGTDGSHVSIHAWTVDVNGVGKWGPEINVHARIRSRGPNWTDDEDRAYKTLMEEAARMKQRGETKWEYISENLLRSGFDRTPKQCQDRGDTIRRPRADPVAGRSTRRKDTMGSPSTSTRSKKSKSLTDAQGPSSSTPLIRDSTSIIIHPSGVRPDESLACPACDQGRSTSGKSEMCTLEWYLSGKEAFARNKKPLTNDQEIVLYQKLLDLELVQVKAKIPIQPYSELRRFLGNLHDVPNANTDKLFEWLMQHLEEDRLEIVNRVAATSDAAE